MSLEHAAPARWSTAGGDFWASVLRVTLEVEVGRSGSARLLRPRTRCESGIVLRRSTTAVNVAERLQQLCALDGDLHYPNPPQLICGPRPLQKRPRAQCWRVLGDARRGDSRVADSEQRKFLSLVAYSPAISRRLAGGPRRIPHSWAGASAVRPRPPAPTLPTNSSILRTACRTVVWSLPPNRRPISGSERSVSVFDRYIATWRGRTTSPSGATTTGRSG